MIVEDHRGIRNQIQTGDRQQSNADYGFFYEDVLSRPRKYFRKRGMVEARPRPLQKTPALKHPLALMPNSRIGKAHTTYQ